MHEDSSPRCRAPQCRTTPEPDYANRGLCARCETTGRMAIEALPSNCADLDRLVWENPATGLTSGSTASGFGPSDPINYTAEALATEIRYAVALWEEIVRDRAGLPAPAGFNVFAGCQFLNTHFTALLMVPVWTIVREDRTVVDMTGVEGILWLTRLHRRASGYIGVDGLTKQLAERCPVCARGRLYHRDGADQVWCGWCRGTWAWAEYASMIEAALFGVAA